MARFVAEDADKYGGQGGGGFFSLTKDGEVKQVRLMYNKAEDVEGLLVHKVEVNGKERYVNCLRNYDDPLEVCPFCRDKKPVQARIFIPIYNINEDAVQVWDRGKTMFSKIMGLFGRYAVKNNLVNNIFEVERHGKANDQKTTYEIYPVEKDETEMEDLPELPDIFGGLVLDKTADEMEYYLETKEFPPTEDDDEEQAEEETPRRRSESRRESVREREPQRRTPARRGKSDRF